MDLALILLIVAVIAIGGAVAIKDPALLWEALGHSGKLIGTVWLDLLLGFVLAGLIHVIIPEPAVIKWLGKQNLWYGVLAGWGLGLLIPGGPYVTFPIAANLLRQGAAPGPLIALISASLLASERPEKRRPMRSNTSVPQNPREREHLGAQVQARPLGRGEIDRETHAAVLEIEMDDAARSREDL